MSPEMIQEAVNNPYVINQVMQGAPMGVLKDICLMSVLIVASKIIRTKVRFLQDFFIPVSVIAGFIALILGPQVLQIMPFSSFMGKYPWILIVTLFATFPFGPKKTDSGTSAFKKSGISFFYNMWAEVAQFALASVLGIFIISKVWDVSAGFAWMLPAGFAGGDRYAQSIGSSFQATGFEDAVSVGMTMATIGIFTAIFGGVLMINYATRKGYTNYIKETKDLPESLRSGLLSKEERTPLGVQTVSSNSIETLTWHLALTLCAVISGFWISGVISDVEWLKIGGSALYLPEMCTAMLAGIAINRFLRLFKLDEYIDRDIMKRIGSTSSDYLVGFGIASINITVVINYWQPILFMVIVGIAWVVFNCLFIARRVFKEDWFENGIFTYGWSTGTVAFGVILLRIVDPHFKSEVLNNYGIAYTIISPIEICIVALGPTLYATYGVATTAIFIIGSAILLAVMRRYYWQKPLSKPPVGANTP